MKKTLLLASLFYSLIAYSQSWNANIFQNTSVAQSTGTPQGLGPSGFMVSDGFDGIILAGNQFNSGTAPSCRISHWGKSGMYTNASIEIPNILLTNVVNDRNGGMYFSYIRNGGLFLGRVDDQMDTVFMQIQVPFMQAQGNLQAIIQCLTEDGSGKMVFAYAEEDTASPFHQLQQVVKLNTDGSPVWSTVPKTLYSQDLQFNITHDHTVYTGDGGIITALGDYYLPAEALEARSFAFNRTDANGTSMWTPLPRIQIPGTNFNTGSKALLTRDELGGTWVTYTADQSITSRSAFLQRIMANGSLVYAGNGKEMATGITRLLTAPDRSRGMLLVYNIPDGSGTSTFLDHVNSAGLRVDSMVNLGLAQNIVAVYSTSAALYVLSQSAQATLAISKYSHNGQKIYGPAAVCGLGNTPKSNFNLHPDDADGIYVSWTEDRGNNQLYNTYAMHLDATGNATGSNTGVQESDQVILALYPQPANTQIYLNTTSPVAALQVLDLQGRNCIEQSFENPDLTTRFSFHLPQGLYLLHVKTAEGIQVTRLMVE